MATLQLDVSLIDVITKYLGPPQGRVGDRSDRGWWVCPFHEDRNPSLCVRHGDHRFKCFGCGKCGDAPDFVRAFNPGMTFPEAIASLGAEVPSRRVDASPPRPKSRPRPDGWRDFIEELVTRSVDRLRSPDGAEARAYLGGRCLTEETIRSAWIGCILSDEYRSDVFEDKPVWIPAGIVVPWIEEGRVEAVNIRRYGEKPKPKYVMIRGSQRRVYPTRGLIRPGRPLAILEGEFEALLMNQELGDLMPSVTMGSASDKPDVLTLDAMMAASPWFVAGDTDAAGEQAAENWARRSKRARRVLPPAPFKDWTQVAQAGTDLKRWWAEFLGSGGKRQPADWDRISKIRWGPAIGDPEPGIVISSEGSG